MIDLHSHVLPGLDDGAATIEDSVALARAAAADGVRVLAATPHVRSSDYPTPPEAMERALGEVRAAVAAAGIALEVRGGGEVALDRLDELDRDTRRRFGLAGNPSYLLVEFPYRGWPAALRERVFQLQLEGVTPVLAHPERNDEVQARPDRLEPLVAAGALVQLTASSLDGRGGRVAQRTALALLDAGAAHLLASDAHTADVRAAGLSAAAAGLDDASLAEWLTVGVPGAIVAGEPLPERPPRPRRRGLFGRARP